MALSVAIISLNDGLSFTNINDKIQNQVMQCCENFIKSKLKIFIYWCIYDVTKELSLRNKIKYLNLNIFRTRCCKPLIFQTQIIWSKRIHSLKYLRSATFGSKDIVIRKSEFVTKTQFLCLVNLSNTRRLGTFEYLRN